MSGPLGRVLVGGNDNGAGFALGRRLVVTAYHVVRDRADKPVAYVPAGGQPVEVERVQPDPGHDAAILWLVSDVGEFLPTSVAGPAAGWRVDSPPPGGNDPPLHGTVTTARTTIQNASGQLVEVVQLEVSEQLGDFGGYSGSAVLDALGRSVQALLVEQKPLRRPVALGEQQAASNVLYAVPIGDVITANSLSVRTSKPPRFGVGFLPPGMVSRTSLLDEAVGLIIGSEGRGTGTGLLLLRGPGGVGKTVLARQAADDMRVWTEFPDGIVMLRAGQTATADSVARQLQEALGYRDRDLADLLGGQRLLLVIDDVWDRELLATLRAGLPPTVAVLVTTRGVSVPGAAAVPVGAVSREEAVQILARGSTRSGELDDALAGLAETLFRWPLLLTLAAAEIHRDDEFGWELDDKDDSRPEGEEQSVLVGRAEALRADFPDDPTMLDDLERAVEGASPRSVDVLVRRSLEWMGAEHQARFELLAIYPPGAAISEPMLEDLWDTSPNATRKQVKLLVRAGVAEPVRTDRLTIELHDLISAWLHHACGRPSDPRYQPVHQRLAELSLLPDGSPGGLTGDRAEWLSYHLVSAGAWDRLAALSTLKWRSAFLVATGSDAMFLAALDLYGHAALAQTHDPLYHAVRAWLFAAHVRGLIGQLPVSLLVAMAMVGDPMAGITQAAQHPSAGTAVPAVLAAVADRVDAGLLIERAVAAARTIPESWEREDALAGIAKWLAGADPGDPALVERAVAVAQTSSDSRDRGLLLGGIGEWLAGADPGDPALIERALALVETIPDDGQRSEALAGIAVRLAVTDPARTSALIDRALAVAEAIPDDRGRSYVLADVAERLADADPVDLALIERAVAVAETIPGDTRFSPMFRIAERLPRADPRDPALIERVLAVAEAIPYDGLRSKALADIAGRLAVTDPARASALIDRALAVAEAIPDDRGRSYALADIAERLAVTDPARASALIDKALAVAEAIIPAYGVPGLDGLTRSAVLADIAKRLAGADPVDPAVIERAVDVAEAIPDDRHRIRVLAGIAGRLAVVDPDGAWVLIERALAVAETVSDDERRSDALASIAKQLAGIAERLAITDPARTSALIDRALAASEAIPYDPQRSGALADIAERLASADPRDPALIERALALAETIPGGWQRSSALARIAERLADVDLGAPALLERAVAVAGTIRDDRARGRALAGIAARLAVTEPAQATALIDQALAASEAIPNNAWPSPVLASTAERVAAADPRDPALVELALALAGTIPDKEYRSYALAGIAERLIGADPRDPALIERALALAGTIPDIGYRSYVLAGIATRLALTGGDGTAALIDRAVAVAETIPDDRGRSYALAGIAARLAVIDRPQTAALIERTVVLAGIIPDDRDRKYELAGIAKRLTHANSGDPGLLNGAVAVVGTIPDDWVRSHTLAAIAGRLACADPRDPALLKRAVALAGTIPDDTERENALAAIAERLAVIDPAPTAALIERAGVLVKAIADDRRRSDALAAMASRLAVMDPDRTAGLIQRALAIAETTYDDQKRRDALADVAERLACLDPTWIAALIERARALAGTIPSDERRSRALAEIAERLVRAYPVDPALIDRGLAMGSGMGIPVDYRNPELIDRALAVAGTIPDERQRGRALARVRALTTSNMLDELSLWRLWSIGESIRILKVLLEHCPDKTTTERIGLAVLDVVKEFPARM